MLVYNEDGFVRMVLQYVVWLGVEWRKMVL